MLQAFFRFNKGILRMPAYVPPWLMLLMAANVVVPMFYLGRIEAQVCAATFMVSACLMVVLTHLSGFSRLLGAGHVLWIPLVYFLWTRLEQAPATDFYGIWMRAVMLLNSISLVIDITDVIRYISGDRGEIVDGL
ncbi:MAG: hypothetical protein GY953_19530 [bacterium]|nr:hypothetical protein [bacterium]